MEDRIERFRGRVVKHFGGRPGLGARYPEDQTRSRPGAEPLRRLYGELASSP